MAAKQSDGSYTASIDLKDHKNDIGKYNIHVYGTDNAEKMVFLGNTSVDIGTQEMTASSVEATVEDNKIKVTISGIKAPNGIKQILVPVWSDVGGQDDIVWYVAAKQSDGSYTANIDPKNHNNDLGVYNIHVYGIDNANKMAFLGNTLADIGTQEMTASSVEAMVEDNKIKVKISGIEAPNGVKKISVPVWSEVGGQDDIVWYAAAKQGDGSYTVSIDPKNHNNDLGHYNIHVYGTDNADKMVFLGATTVEKKTITPIMGESLVTAQALIKYYKDTNAIYPQEYSDRDVDLETFVNYYIQEAEAEGVRAEVAFAQAMIETGNLQFGGDVKVTQFNFAGLGATGGEPGFDFAKEYGDDAVGIQMGVRAHVQHLKCYASDLPLNQENVDPRWGDWIRLRAPIVEELSGTWAMDPQYAKNILKVINQF